MLSSCSFIKKFSPSNNFARAVIIFYQATFSQFLGGNCRYFPSCSHYALESFENFTFLHATRLVLKRFLTCHPFSRKSFYDPVPFAKIETRIK